MILDSVFGLSLEVVVVILLIAILLLIVFLVLTNMRLTDMMRKYYSLTNGKGGADLETIMLTRFKEMDRVKARMKKYTREHKEFKLHLDSCYNKLGVVKYDAFDDMAGELSFSVALLNDENSGMVLSSMHSKQGCFTYAKEIIHGESYMALSKEEKEAIRKAETIDEEIDRMISQDTEILEDEKLN